MTQRSHSRRVFWIGLTLAATALSLMAGFVGWTLDPARLQPRLIDAVQRATGRTLTVSGKMAIRLSLVPTVSMEDVTLSNPPEFSRPEMVKVARVEMGLALLPLLRHRFEVDHVTLVRPDIVLETDPAGRANWAFARTAPPAEAVVPGASAEGLPNAASSAAAAPDSAAKQRFTVSFKGAGVDDARIGWIDGQSGRHYLLEAPRLFLTAPPGGPVQLTGTVLFEGRTVAVTARAVPGDMSEGFPGTAPWPVSVRLESGGATLTAEGQIAQPLRGRGYSMAIDANFPDTAVLAPYFPHVPFAALKSLTAHAEMGDSGGAIPTISLLRVRLGSADLEKLVHGARLEDVNVTARDGAPAEVAARVKLPGSDSAISGTIGDLAWLTDGATGPVAVDLEWKAASARAGVKGSIQAPARLAGVALDVAVDVGDPSLVMNSAPPLLKSVAFRTRLTDAPGPVPFQLTSSAGDLTGALTVSRLPRLSVEGQVSSRRLDLDMLRTRMPADAPVAVPSDAAVPSMDAPSGSGSPSAAPVPPPRDGIARVIPDVKLPFAFIRSADANIKFDFAQVRFGGADIRRIDGMVSVKDGTLRLDPFTIAAPDQRLSALLVVDGAKTPPAVHLSVDAPGLALRPLLAVLGLPRAATGTVQVRADLAGAGDSPRSLAASLDGWAGIAIEGGQLDAQMVDALLGALRPLHVGGPGVTDLRCFAMRADAKSGIVTIKPVALNTAALIVDGGGEVDLGQETLALRLRPRTKIGGTGIAVPMRVSGTIRSPSARLDISGGGPLAGLLLGGKDVMGAAGGGDPCPAALVRAREGASPFGTAPFGTPEDAPQPLPPDTGGSR